MKKYQIIYADPPWSYRVWRKKEHGRTAESHYSTMTIEDIRTLPVGQLADKNCKTLFKIATSSLVKVITILSSTLTSS